jgi:hypothetical protein
MYDAFIFYHIFRRIFFYDIDKKDICGIIVIMKLAIFKANIAIMISSKYRPLYRMALYAIIIFSLVQVALLVAALGMKSESLPQVAAKILVIYNVSILIFDLVNLWNDGVVKTERTEEEQRAIWKRLRETLCRACGFFVFYGVLLLPTTISAFLYAYFIILSTDGAFIRNCLFTLLFIPFGRFLYTIYMLIQDNKEQLEEEELREFLLQCNRTTEA